MKQKTTCNIYSKKVPKDFKKTNGKKTDISSSPKNKRNSATCSLVLNSIHAMFPVFVSKKMLHSSDIM
jgi:hypothetical protein